MMELLAPAGNMASLDACVTAGADAVYLGLDALNARRGAANFGPDELREAAGKLHSRGMKLYVTVNTLVKDDEFETLDRVIGMLADSGADAAITQDIGASAYIKKALPSLDLHASTQMAVHNYQGARWLKKAGFSRAILAREVTFDDIAACAREGVEIEAFGHGALCVSCSGQCLMSSMVGGRSGNRGLCAQPCRLGYSLAGKSGDLLSPKDLMTVESLSRLEKAGVRSLKLEGRLKSPEYVYAVVSAYRRALDGEKIDPEDLRHSFNRGFTKGYYAGVDDREITSDPTTEHVLAGDISYEPREKRFPIDVSVLVKIGDNLEMSAADGVSRVTAVGDKVEPAQKAGLDESAVSRQILKTGGTPYDIKSFSADVDPGAFVRLSALNALRRDCLLELSDMRIERNRGCLRDIRSVPPVSLAPADVKRTLLSVESARPEMLKIARENGADEIIYMPMDLTKLPEDIDCDAISVPPTLPGESLDVLNAWANKMGFKATLISNPAHLAMDWPGEKRIDWPMNIFNSRAVEELKMSYTPSLELTAAEIARLAGDKELLVYGRVALMRLRMCPMHALRAPGPHDKCDACADRLFLDCPLIDRRNTAFPLMRLKTGKGCIIYVLNSVPLMLLRRADRLPKAGRWRATITDEDENACAAIVRAHRAAIDGREIADYEFMDKMKTTTGHYFRGVD